MKWKHEVDTGSVYRNVYRKLIQEVDTGSGYMTWIEDVDRGRG